MSNVRDGGESYDKLQALRDDFSRLRTDVEDLLDALDGRGRERLHELRGRVQTAVQEKAEAAREKAEAVSTAATERAKQVKRSAEQHPLTAAVAALCLGVVIGVVIKGHGQ